VQKEIVELLRRLQEAHGSPTSSSATTSRSFARWPDERIVMKEGRVVERGLTSRSSAIPRTRNTRA
jgi:ABC-type microcin C transport system duplicated ATPase subunit YejF